MFPEPTVTFVDRTLRRQAMLSLVAIALTPDALTCGNAHSRHLAINDSGNGRSRDHWARQGHGAESTNERKGQKYPLTCSSTIPAPVPRPP
jgi:hypothetical protein